MEFIREIEIDKLKPTDYNPRKFKDVWSIKASYCKWK